MLILTRKDGQTIVIGDITVHVFTIGEERVKIGIEAPRGVEIVRGELPTTSQTGAS